MTRQRILVWKCEDGRPEDSGGAPTDVGPAWIDTFQGDSLVSQKRVDGGRWITRAEAWALAEREGYLIQIDDGLDSDSPAPRRFAADVSAINERLRTLGVAEDEVRVIRQGGALMIVGSRVATATGLRQFAGDLISPDLRIVASSEKQLVRELERLVPTWQGSYQRG